jgi:hypothetical protein
LKRHEIPADSSVIDVINECDAAKLANSLQSGGAKPNTSALKLLLGALGLRPQWIFNIKAMRKPGKPSAFQNEAQELKKANPWWLRTGLPETYRTDLIARLNSGGLKIERKDQNPSHRPRHMFPNMRLGFELRDEMQRLLDEHASEEANRRYQTGERNTPGGGLILEIEPHRGLRARATEIIIDRHNVSKQAIDSSFKNMQDFEEMMRKHRPQE